MLFLIMDPHVDNGGDVDVDTNDDDVEVDFSRVSPSWPGIDV